MQNKAPKNNIIKSEFIFPKVVLSFLQFARDIFSVVKVDIFKKYNIVIKLIPF